MIVSGFLAQVSDGERVLTYLLTDAPYHDPALASRIEYGTALPVIPSDAGLTISEKIRFQPQGGSSSVGISSIPLINTEGHFDQWGRWTLSGLEWIWGRGYADQPWSEWFKCYFRGGPAPEFRGRDEIIVTLRDAFGYMRQPIASQVFSEEDVSNTKLINTTVPMVFGSAFQVDPLLTEPQILRYAVGSNVNDVPAVQEGGNPSTPIFEYVPLGFQLFASPSMQITCDVTGPPLPGWQENNVLDPIGALESWTAGVPAGWKLSEDAPHSTITESTEGALVTYSAVLDGDTGWQSCGLWEVPDNASTTFVPQPGTDTLADVLEADDGTYAKVQSEYGSAYRLTGSQMGITIPPNTEPISMEVRITLDTAGGNQDVALRQLQLKFPDGTARSVLPLGMNWVPNSKGTLTFNIDNNNSQTYRLTKEILEDPEFGIVAVVRQQSGNNQLVRIHEIGLKVEYGTIIDRSRLTTESDVLETGKRYLMRIHTVGGSGDAVHAYWGTVADETKPIDPGTTYLQTDALLEGEDVHEFSVVADAKRFAIEFDRGTGNGNQDIKLIELIDKSASRERFKQLQRYIHEVFGKDPDEACDNDALQLVQDQANNPRLGWYVDDQSTGAQLSTLLAHSLGAVAWGSLTGKWTAAQLRVPQQPAGEYLSIEGAFAPGISRPDEGDDLRDRVHAARNVHPLRDSETAGVTTTWPEEQRQLVIDKWRITERADFDDLEGYGT